ncbi:MAG: DUF2975 domain-containing protein [Rhodothermales bacterium]|nr:DUF2975 domain-containing protein [Rhodothermales bacterium]MBO6779309.1 DUF2975 domain-containing protein [Rhodothermales bacterium]
MIQVLDRVLTFLWWAALGIVVFAAAIGAWAALGQPENVEFNWFAYDVSEELLEKAGGQAEIDLGDSMSIKVEEASLRSSDPALAWFGMVMGSAFFAVFMFGFHRVRQVVRSAVDGTPFIRENVTRLREIGFIYVAEYLILGVAQVTAGFVARSRIPDELAESSLSLNVNPVVIVTPLVLFALAEVFKAGVDLQEEQDLTV